MKRAEKLQKKTKDRRSPPVSSCFQSVTKIYLDFVVVFPTCKISRPTYSNLSLNILHLVIFIDTRYFKKPWLTYLNKINSVVDALYHIIVLEPNSITYTTCNSLSHSCSCSISFLNYRLTWIIKVL